MLSNTLKTKAQVAMTNFLSKVDRGTEDVDTQYEAFVDEFVGQMYLEAEPWWKFREQNAASSFSEDALTMKEMNVLLRADADLWERESVYKKSGGYIPPSSVEELLRRYGVWAFQIGHSKDLAKMFDRVWENA